MLIERDSNQVPYTECVYGLMDPADRVYRYFGCTCEPETRYSLHMYEDKIPEFAQWWRDIIARGDSVLMRIISTHYYRRDALAFETLLITAYADGDRPLFNIIGNPQRRYVPVTARERIAPRRREKISRSTPVVYKAPEVQRDFTYVIAGGLTEYQRTVLGYQGLGRR